MTWHENRDLLLGFKKSHIDISNFLGGLNTSLPTQKKLGIFPKFLPRFLCFVLDPPHTVCTLCLSSPQPPVCAFHSSPPVCAFRSSHPVHVFFSSSPLLVGFVHPPLFIHLIPHLWLFLQYKSDSLEPTLSEITPWWSRRRVKNNGLRVSFKQKKQAMAIGEGLKQNSGIFH